MAPTPSWLCWRTLVRLQCVLCAKQQCAFDKACCVCSLGFLCRFLTLLVFSTLPSAPPPPHTITAVGQFTQPPSFTPLFTPLSPMCYPGYDMEDGMILNKASVDRGFAHATLYKTEMIDLRDKGSTTQRFQAEGGDARPFVKREAANLVRRGGGMWVLYVFATLLYWVLYVLVTLCTCTAACGVQMCTLAVGVVYYPQTQKKNKNLGKTH